MLPARRSAPGGGRVERRPVVGDRPRSDGCRCQRERLGYASRPPSGPGRVTGPCRRAQPRRGGAQQRPPLAATVARRRRDRASLGGSSPDRSSGMDMVPSTGRGNTRERLAHTWGWPATDGLVKVRSRAQVNRARSGAFGILPMGVRANSRRTPNARAPCSGRAALRQYAASSTGSTGAPVGRLHHRDDPFAEPFVGHAEHRARRDRGCSWSTRSTSAGYTFAPPRMTTSFMRSFTNTPAGRVEHADVAGVQQPAAQRAARWPADGSSSRGTACTRRPMASARARTQISPCGPGARPRRRLVDDHDLDRRERHAAATGEQLVARHLAGHRRGSLGEPVPGEHRRAEPFEEQLPQGVRRRRAAAFGPAQRHEIGRRPHRDGAGGRARSPARTSCG